MCITIFFVLPLRGKLGGNDHEGEPKWWKISELGQIDMQDDIRERYIKLKNIYKKKLYYIGIPNITIDKRIEE